MTKIVIDVGANTGTFSKHVLNISTDYRVIAIEPNAEKCKKTLDEIESQYQLRFKHFSLALGRNSGKANFFSSQVMGSQLASLLPLNPRAKWPDSVKTNLFSSKSLLDNVLVIEVLAVKDFIKQNKIERIDFLKIDTQGTDLELLEEFLQNCEVVAATVEVEIDSTNPQAHYLQELDHFFELNRILLKYGYSLYKVTPNGVDTAEYNFFLGRDRKEFWDICEELQISGSPVFGSFWEIMGVGQRLNEDFARTRKAFLKKLAQALKHPKSSYRSVIYKLTR